MVCFASSFLRAKCVAELVVEKDFWYLLNVAYLGISKGGLDEGNHVYGGAGLRLSIP